MAKNPDSIRQRALAAGLKLSTVYRRIYELGWPVEKALSTPARSPGTSIYDIAKMNGVSPSAARNRVHILGWRFEDAVTKPTKDANTYRRYLYNGTKHTISELECMSGVDRGILSHRINTLKWSVEKAMRTPVRERSTHSIKFKVTSSEPLDSMKSVMVQPVCPYCGEDVDVQSNHEKSQLLCRNGHEIHLHNLLFQAVV